jgi:hypothetical protein
MLWWSSKARGIRGGRSHSLESTAVKFLLFAKVKSDGGKHDFFFFFGQLDENFLSASIA